MYMYMGLTAPRCVVIIAKMTWISIKGFVSIQLF